MAEIETEAPPVGEEIHMPEPSILPVVNAVGLTLALVGITLSLTITVVGLVIFLVLARPVDPRGFARDVRAPARPLPPLAGPGFHQ